MLLSHVHVHSVEMDPTPTTPDIGAQRAEDGPSSKKKEETKKSDK